MRLTFCIDHRTHAYALVIMHMRMRWSSHKGILGLQGPT